LTHRRRERRGSAEKGRPNIREPVGPSTTLTEGIGLEQGHEMACPCGTGSARPVQEQAVEGHVFGLQGIELDLGELALVDFAPAIDARL